MSELDIEFIYKVDGEVFETEDEAIEYCHQEEQGVSGGYAHAMPCCHSHRGLAVLIKAASERTCQFRHWESSVPGLPRSGIDTTSYMGHTRYYI